MGTITCSSSALVLESDNSSAALSASCVSQQNVYLVMAYVIMACIVIAYTGVRLCQQQEASPESPGSRVELVNLVTVLRCGSLQIQQ